MGILNYYKNERHSHSENGKGFEKKKSSIFVYHETSE